MEKATFCPFRRHSHDCRMTEGGVKLILRALQDRRKPLDIRLILFAMKEGGYINQCDHDRVLSTIKASRYEGWQKVLLCVSEAARLVTFQGLLRILTSTGAKDLSEEILRLQTEDIRQIPGSKTECTALMHAKYDQLKRIVGNSSFYVNKFVDFENLTISAINELANAQTPGSRQVVFDSLAVVTCLRVHMYEDMRCREAILEQMLSLGQKHPDLDQTCANVVHLVSKCYISRKLNQIEEAKGFLNAAKQLCMTHNNSLIKAIVFHAEHALYRKLYAINPCEENLNQSIVACERGIASVAQGHNNVRQHWIRDFQLFKALSLLGVGQEYQIEKDMVVPPENLDCAKCILQMLKEDFSEWDERRETMYRVGMSRLLEYSDLRQAVWDIDLAIEHGQKGNYTTTEETNLMDYRRYLTEKRGTKVIYKRLDHDGVS